MVLNVVFYSKVRLAEEEKSALMAAKMPERVREKTNTKSSSVSQSAKRYKAKGESKSDESVNMMLTVPCKLYRGAKIGYKPPTLSSIHDDELNNVLSRLNHLLKEVNDNNVHVTRCKNCKQDIKQALSSITGLLVKVSGAAENDTKRV